LRSDDNIGLPGLRHASTSRRRESGSNAASSPEIRPVTPVSGMVERRTAYATPEKTGNASFSAEGRPPQVTPHTRFRLGALSKPLTAVAAGVLYDRGRFDLDAPIRRYVLEED
jgi:hypothetical protein